MFKIKKNTNQKINQINITQFLFYAFPLSFILGNLILTINLLLFVIISLFLIKKQRMIFRFKNEYWLLIIFFTYFALSTTVQWQGPGLLEQKIQHFPDHPIFKSFLLIRFPILIFIIDTLFYNKILNLKKLFLSSFVCTSFVSLDVVLQYITGSDLFGFKTVLRYNAGPFGDELIAGGYLKNLSFFSFFYIFDYIKNKNINVSLLIFIVVIHLSAILMSGNRMPMILFVFGCLLIILLVKNIRIIMLISLLIFTIIFSILVKVDTKIYNSYSLFFNTINVFKQFQITKLVTNIEKKEEVKGIKNIERIQKEQPRRSFLLRWSGHNRTFNTAIEMWKEQPLFGFGFKSFRFKCWKMLEKDNEERKITKEPQRINCANHPHNYYLELLSEAGIIGTSLLIAFFIVLLKYSFNYLKKYNIEKNSKVIFLIPVATVMFLEIWPLKSSGSFFTSWNATFFWLSAAILMSADKINFSLKSIKKFKN